MFDIIRKYQNSKPIELNLTSLLDETNMDGSGTFVEKDDTFLDPNTSVSSAFFLVHEEIFQTTERSVPDEYIDIRQ